MQTEREQVRRLVLPATRPEYDVVKVLPYSGADVRDLAFAASAGPSVDFVLHVLRDRRRTRPLHRRALHAAPAAGSGIATMPRSNRARTASKSVG